MAYMLTSDRLCAFGLRPNQQESVPAHPLQAGEPITQTSQLRHDWHAMVMCFLMVDRFKNGDSTND